MDHEAFASRTKTALRAQSEGRHEWAVTELRTLLEEIEAAGKTAITDWHQQQVLSLLVDALDAADRVDECRAAWEELILFNQQSLTYWQTAVSAASEDFSRWKTMHSQ